MAPAKKSKQRPLSPHLQVYRLPYNALMSIIGRGVGVGLSLALTVVLVWFSWVLWDPSIYDMTMSVLELPVFKYLFLLAAFAIFFYIGNGVRHVLWDMVIGVDVKSGVTTGNIVLVISALMTAGLWLLGCDCLMGLF